MRALRRQVTLNRRRGAKAVFRLQALEEGALMTRQGLQWHHPSSGPLARKSPATTDLRSWHRLPSAEVWRAAELRLTLDILQERGTGRHKNKTCQSLGSLPSPKRAAEPEE